MQYTTILSIQYNTIQNNNSNTLHIMRTKLLSSFSNQNGHQSLQLQSPRNNFLKHSTLTIPLKLFRLSKRLKYSISIAILSNDDAGIYVQTNLLLHLVIPVVYENKRRKVAIDNSKPILHVVSWTMEVEIYTGLRQHESKYIS